MYITFTPAPAPAHTEVAIEQGSASIDLLVLSE